MTASLLARRAFARVVIFLACLLGLAMLPARADDTAASMYVGLGASGYAPVIVPLRRAVRERAQGTRFAQLSDESGQLTGTSMRASFYGGGPRSLEPNSHTANGERFNQWAMTAAHRSLPFGTRLQVCHAACVVVRINDRGPASWTGKSLDLSRGAARAIGFPGSGTVRVAFI